MTDQIFYNYGANYEQLDGIKANLNDATAIREHVHTVFNLLQPAYQGEAAASLQAAHGQVSVKMDAHITDMQATHQQAVTRQADTASLDAQLSGGF
jgi:hypothetical protein